VYASPAPRYTLPIVQTVTDPADLAALEGLLAFWRDAGVDQMYADEPQDRRAPVKPRLEPSPAFPVAAPAVARAPDLADAIAQAKALAAGAQTLEALEAAIAGFDGCPLKFEGAKRAVFSRGDPKGAIMAIGEAPGADEDAQGSPFVGRAGKLLDAMLKASNLSDHVFITNTVYWRPPGNRTPSPQEQAVCAPFVERAIALVKPRFLLLLGAASAKSLLKRPEGILALRGKWLDWTSQDGALTLPALPTLHPAFLLRQPSAKKKAWADLLSLADRLDRDG
jgi:DNA polymerase